MLMILGPDGLKRPYRVCTMDYVWKEAARSVGLTTYFFEDKLLMMRFVLKYGIEKGDKPVAIVVRDGSGDSAEMSASLHAMGFIEMNVAQTGEV